jgi:L-rhamnose mutarotase
MENVMIEIMLVIINNISLYSIYLKTAKKYIYSLIEDSEVVLVY